MNYINCISLQNMTVSKYKVKINDGGKEYVEEIIIDTKKQTETFHIPKMNSSNAGEVDVIYGFKNVSKSNGVVTD